MRAERIKIFIYNTRAHLTTLTGKAIREYLSTFKPRREYVKPVRRNSAAIALRSHELWRVLNLKRTNRCLESGVALIARSLELVAGD